jgi:hypothetical protein
MPGVEKAKKSGREQDGRLKTVLLSCPLPNFSKKQRNTYSPSALV